MTVFKIAGHNVKLDGIPLSQSAEVKHAVPEAFVNFEGLRKEGKDFDATVTVGDKKMQGHKALLSARVPFFRGLFESSMAEATSGEVSIANDQFDASAVEALLVYVYTGFISLTETNVFETMVAANFLGIESVMDECAQFMRKRLHTGNALTILMHCRQMGYHKIDDILHRFIDKNAYTISETPEFRALSVDELESFLRRSSLNVESELQVFEMISRWMGDDKAKWAHAEQLVRAVRCTHLSAAEFAVVANTTPWLAAAPAATQLLEKAKGALGNPAELAALDGTFDMAERHCDEAQRLVFVVGQTPAQSKPIDSPMAFYDPIMNEWTSCGKLNSTRGRNGVAILDNKIYAIGGFDGTARLNTCEVYDLEKAKWNKMENMSTARSAMATGVIDGKIFVAGGWTDQTATEVVEIYDPATAAWSFGTSMMHKRATPASCVLNGKLYVIGGHDGQQIFKDGELFDPATQSWTPIAPMKHKRCRFGAAVYNGYIYVAGGFDGAAFLRDVERYNPATNTWEAVASTKERRSRATLAVSSGRLFVFGGFDGLNNVSSVEMYLPEANTWVKRAPMPEHFGGVFVGTLPVPTSLASPVANLEAADVAGPAAN